MSAYPEHVSDQVDPVDAIPVAETLMQTGGPVTEGRTYLERPADRELPAIMRTGALCALFAPRQEGKTSLMLRTMRRLAADGVRCAFVDLGSLAPSTATEQDLFQFLAEEIASQLDDEAAASVRDITSSASFIAWLTRLAARSTANIAIFIDEIHQMLDAPVLGDCLLLALRALHDGRARTPAPRRVSYCVAGVARPRDLVADPSRDPFETGTVIRLEDFTLDELAPLRGHFARHGMPEQTLDHVFRWTHGHPFMTSKLVRELTSEPMPELAAVTARVDGAVEATLLSEAYATEHYLADARLLFDGSKRFGNADLGRAIELYRRLLRHEAVRDADAGDSAVVLVLAGIVAGRTRDNVRYLEPRNRITQEVFGDSWLDRMEVTRYLDVPLQTWLSLERSPRALLSGEPLEAAVAVASRASDVTPAQRGFLLASLEASHQAELARRERGYHELEYRAVTATSRLRRSTMLGGVLLLVVLVILGVFALRSSGSAREAEQLRAQLRDQAALAESLKSAAAAQRDIEANRLADLEAAEARAKRAATDAEVARQRASAATIDREQLKLHAQDAERQADQLMDVVKVARREAQAARKAAAAANQREKDATASLEIARTATEALRAELDGRRAIEQRLSEERNRSLALQSDLDSSRRQLEATRQEADSARKQAVSCAAPRMATPASKEDVKSQITAPLSEEPPSKSKK